MAFSPMQEPINYLANFSLTRELLLAGRCEAFGNLDYVETTRPRGGWKKRSEQREWVTEYTDMRRRKGKPENLLRLQEGRYKDVGYINWL